MSTEKSCYVRCDSCDEVTPSDMDCARIAEAREQARLDGFHQRPGGRDICGACWEAGER